MKGAARIGLAAALAVWGAAAAAPAAAGPKQPPLPATGMTVAGPGVTEIEDGEYYDVLVAEADDLCINVLNLGGGDLQVGYLPVPPQGLSYCYRPPGITYYRVFCLGSGACKVAWRFDRFVRP